VVQGQAFQQFHSDERLAVLVINLVYCADVWMIEGRSGFGFALEAGESVRAFGRVIGQKLEGDRATEFEIFGLVHHSHSPSTQPLEDAVMRDSLADH
jgi:hypothetical protein